MAINSLHPTISEFSDDWELCRDSYDITPIKKKRDQYLPPTSGHIIDGFGKADSVGEKCYNSYLKRAYYPDIFREAVAAAIGVMHRKPPVIELPSALETLRENATNLGESLEMVLRRINTEQLISGRVGVLLDIEAISRTDATFNIAIYREATILNWDDTIRSSDVSSFRLAVLDESSYEINNSLEWELKENYLILALAKPSAEQGKGLKLTDDRTGTYSYAKAGALDSVETLEFTPVNYKGKTLDAIPFVTINSSDISPTPDTPPLLGLAELCLLIYRGEADYRQNLFMQGQDTFVTIGDRTTEEGEAIRTGAGARVSVPMGGDAKYVGVNSQGLPEQRMALENDYKRAYSKSGQISDATSRAKESGDALRLRVSAQTATLPQIALSAAAGLEKVLKAAAVLVGANPDEVSVTPNLEFTDSEGNAQTLVSIVQAKAQGAPISQESIHAYMVEQKFTKKTYDEEFSLLQSEAPSL